MIQRYTIYGHYDDDDDLVITTIRLLDDCGDFVKYTDHLVELEAVKNRVCGCHNKQASTDAKIRWNDNKINYCPYCGGKIEIKELEKNIKKY